MEYSSYSHLLNYNCQTVLQETAHIYDVVLKSASVKVTVKLY